MNENLLRNKKIKSIRKSNFKNNYEYVKFVLQNHGSGLSSQLQHQKLFNSHIKPSRSNH